MKQDEVITLYKKTEGHQDSHGGWIPGTNGPLKDIYCDVQPYSRELLLKQYGYDINVNVRIFIDCIDIDIKIGTTLSYINQQGITENYEVKAIPWNKGHMEVVCLAIQE